jgi:hypothetical protein
MTANKYRISYFPVVNEDGSMEYGAEVYIIANILTAPTRDQLEDLIAATLKAYTEQQINIFSI